MSIHLGNNTLCALLLIASKCPNVFTDKQELIFNRALDSINLLKNDKALYKERLVKIKRKLRCLLLPLDYKSVIYDGETGYLIRIGFDWFFKPINERLYRLFNLYNSIVEIRLKAEIADKENRGKEV
jgi:hypothetical protein